MKVVVIGASGETGRSIVRGLHESTSEFDITSIARTTSVDSKHNQELKKHGVKVVGCDITSPKDDWVQALTGAEVVISACHFSMLKDQSLIADAAKEADVGRFIPCFFGPIAPPKGVMALRDVKEDVLNHIKKIHLPFTIIDVGWWYQIASPRLPSGRIDKALSAPVDRLVGDGAVPSALTHLRDVGRYVARIITDSRTLNKMVFVHNELLSQGEICDKLERISGEKLERTYVSKDELEADIAKYRDLMRSNPTDGMVLQGLYASEYRYSWGIRGDNTPDYAEYLGYLNGKELYPDFEFTSFDAYVNEMLEGKAQKVYAQ